MSSILYVCDLTPGTRGDQRRAALEELGHQVTALSFVRPRRDSQVALRPPLLDRVARRLGRPRDRVGINDKLLRRARSREYDLLWVEMGTNIRPDTLADVHFEQPQMQSIFFSEDDMLMRHNQSRWFRDSLAVYDLAVTTKRRNADPQELPRLGARRVRFEPKTFSPDLHRPLEIDDEDRRRLGADVGFIGTFEEPRGRACLALARAGFEVRVFGNGWHRFRGSHANLRVEGRPVAGDDYVRAIAATKIQLGFLRVANRDEHTDRSVEVPACGGFMLAERTQEHLELFAEGVEAAYFDSEDELIDKVGHYLDADRERRAIAAAGRQRCLDSDYSHHGSLGRILESLGVPARVTRRTPDSVPAALPGQGAPHPGDFVRRLAP